MPTRDAYVIVALALLMFFVAFNLQAGWVYAVDALLAGVLIAGFSSAHHAVRGITAVRFLPPEAVEGRAVTVTVTLWGKGFARRFFVELHDAVPGLDPARIIVPVVAGRRKTEASYQTVAARRGVHQVQTLTLRSGGLTGLFRVQRDVPAPGEITVYPRYWQISRFPLAAWSPALQHVGSARRRGGLEFSGLRDYRSGDSVRHVHWWSSARRGTLVVREFDQELPGSVIILIDTRPEVQVGEGSSSTFEDLIRAAASVAWYVTVRGGVVRILGSTPAGALDLTGGWAPILEALARLQPEGRLAPSAMLATAALRKDHVLLVFTADRQVLPPLSTRGLRVAGVVTDPGSYAGRQDAVSRDGYLALGMPVCMIRRGDDVGVALEQAAS